MKKVLLGGSYQLVCSLGGLLRCGGVMWQIWRSTCTSRGHRLLTYQEVKVEGLIAPLLVWALGRWRCCGKKGDICHWWGGRGLDETHNWSHQCEQRKLEYLKKKKNSDTKAIEKQPKLQTWQSPLYWVSLYDKLSQQQWNTTFSPLCMRQRTI